jgi:Methyltransferase domain
MFGYTMASPVDPRLIALINPDLLFAEPETFSDIGFWHEHIPFALVLMDLLAPRTVVELGAYKGDSYFAFCQAVTRLGLPTRCYAVDTWEGDVHTSAYAEAVHADFVAWNDKHYAVFSTPMRMTFDQAATRFDDGVVDLLHIDGTHTYDAVKHDFETWLPKMSDRGVVLFHDTGVRRDLYGVWKFWDEVRAGRAHFEFSHGNGLGVLGTGPALPEKFREFLDVAQSMPDAVRTLFEALGQRVAYRAASHTQATRIAALETTQEKLFGKVDQLHAELDKLSAAHTTLIGQRDELHVRNAELHRELVAVRTDLAETLAELRAVYASHSWKFTAPMRTIARLLRGG